MTRIILQLLLAILVFSPANTQAAEALALNLRKKVETAPGSGRHHTLTTPTEWPASKTAVVICDMWDKHWCPGATARVNEMAPRMNEVITAARKKGALIIHCPSDTMDFYKDTPQRKRAQAAPKVEPKVALERWCRLDADREGALPIDDSDGGCAEAEKSYKAWTRQHPALTIADEDAITDSDEAYYLMRARGIENVIVMGVHTNMCVLGRPFAIRQLVKQGLNVTLVRDMTDTMYNPAKAPFVSHFTGTDLVVEHIEKYWCPTITSVDLIGGKEFRFAEDKRPHVAIVAAEDEYKTEITLPKFAREHLGKDYRVSFLFADAKERSNLPGVNAIPDADVLFLSVRRKPLQEAQLKLIREFIASGKPVVGIRTTSHAFAPRRGEKLPAGVAMWERIDLDLLGCTYDGHHENTLTTQVSLAAAGHPILKGIPADGFTSRASLYRSKPLAEDTILLLTGVAGKHPVEPIAWIREAAPGRGKVFYTSLGHPADFEEPAFIQLLKNGIAWAAGR